MIIDIKPSPVKNKRYRVIMNNGKHYDFGLKTGSTYLDHKDKDIKKNYWLRHMGNPIENKLIKNLIPSPALFSAYILWGETTDLQKNINNLNRLLAHKK